MLKEQLATEDQYAISITDIPDDQPPSYKTFPSNSTSPPPYPTSPGADIHPAGISALPPPEKSAMAQAVPADQHVPDMESIATIPPGLCPVCRKGQIIERPTWLTWLLCVLLSPCLIVPGVLAFFFCCRAPVCDFCHFQF
ncbi:uncharacterized protein LOC135196731 [Macrobrachium nipponense]|uniref:uncharacterized protein LOC135196731 n=1 Tax=Macrobrachium nipponense TaxID=159736 RepID=UPI0030C80385